MLSLGWCVLVILIPKSLQQISDEGDQRSVIIDSNDNVDISSIDNIQPVTPYPIYLVNDGMLHEKALLRGNKYHRPAPGIRYIPDDDYSTIYEAIYYDDKQFPNRKLKKRRRKPPKPSGRPKPTTKRTKRTTRRPKTTTEEPRKTYVVNNSIGAEFNLKIEGENKDDVDNENSEDRELLMALLQQNGEFIF
ncbi:uncharacterized protein LOC123704161 [Colias croceus]|uniref:uncharacterized protein LOC123704161 n=1 Tax=Colias crocea TaxID=72248 RepID=UPI001E27AEDD|nr:uncharacterized protein LOC123704161 [Colias croceus]